MHYDGMKSLPAAPPPRAVSSALGQALGDPATQHRGPGLPAPPQRRLSICPPRALTLNPLRPPLRGGRGAGGGGSAARLARLSPACPSSRSLGAPQAGGPVTIPSSRSPRHVASLTQPSQPHGQVVPRPADCQPQETRAHRFSPHPLASSTSSPEPGTPARVLVE